MAYSKYYPEGWRDNEEGGTPINAAALNNMETGIAAAHEFMARTDNPNGVTKAQVGLGNAENTADINKNVNSAKTLTNARTIDGVSFNGSANITHYGTCSTDAATTAKTVTCAGFTLAAGARITVKFTVTNTGAVSNLTLNVNSTGAKAIKYRGGNLPAAGTLAAGRLYTFMYDGTNYELVGDLDTDTNTTYAPATAAPRMDGTAAVGTSSKYAREDHVHPTDTSRASADDVAALQKENALLRELINGIDAPIYRTASGNPATFSDGYAANVKALSVEITPTQSGNGDPYPPGGGKNLLNPRNARSGDGVTYTRLDDGSYSRVGTATGEAGNVWFLGGFATTDILFTLRAGHTYFVHDCCLFYNGYGVVNNIRIITPERDLPVGGVRNPIQTIGTAYNDIIHPMIIDLTAFPDTDISGNAWYPYANIRPVSGATSVAVTRTGENLLKPYCVPSSSGLTFSIADDGGIAASGTATAVAYTGTNPTYGSSEATILPPGTYTFSAISPDGITGVFVRARLPDAPGTPVNLPPIYGRGSVTYTFTETATVWYYGYIPEGRTVSGTLYVWANAGNQAAPYSAYQGQRITVSLVDSKSDPLTVYGGRLNVTTGELTVTHGYIKADENSGWRLSGNGQHAILDNALTGRKGQGITGQLWGLCNAQPSSNGVIQFVSSADNVGTSLLCAQIGTNWGLSDATLDNWKAFVSEHPLQVLYELETPATYQLTAAQLATLSGYNVISTDAKSVAVEYRADPTLSLEGG